MKIQPLDDRVVVAPEEAETVSAGGIVLPDSAKEKPQQGKVVVAGPGTLDDDGNRCSLSVKKGDKVVFGKYSGSDIEIDGKKYKIMRERDILAKVVS